MGKDKKGKELGKEFYQRKDGRYEARAVVNGNKINLFSLNLKELKKKFQDTKEQIENQIDYKRKNLKLNDWFEDWFRTYKLPNVKETSVYPMKRKFYNSFGKYLGERKVADITNIDIQTDLSNECRWKSVFYYEGFFRANV